MAKQSTSRSVDANKPIIFVLLVDPQGRIRRAPKQFHTVAPNLFGNTRPSSRIELTNEARHRGWAVLSELYDQEYAETQSAARKAELKMGRDYIFKTYYPAALRGQKVKLSINPPDSGDPTLPVLEERLLPREVIERRVAARRRGEGLMPPPLPRARKQDDDDAPPRSRRDARKPSEPPPPPPPKSEQPEPQEETAPP